MYPSVPSTPTHSDRPGTAIGSDMAFYSRGSAAGAITTTTVYAARGWPAACVLGAIDAAPALITGAVAHHGLAPADGHRPTRTVRACSRAIMAGCPPAGYSSLSSVRRLLTGRCCAGTLPRG